MRKQRQGQQREDTEYHSRRPKMDKPTASIEHGLHHFRKMTDWEQMGSILTNGYILGTGKVTPDKVAPREPTIETTLITNDIAGNSENKNSPKACVAMMKSTVMIFISHQLP